MLRIAVLRSAATAARLSMRSATVRRPIIQAARTVAAPAPKPVSLTAVRFYSEGSGLDKASVQGRIISLLSGFDKVNDVNNINPEAHFANDLGLDSLDTVEVVMAIEEEFSIEIPDKDADKIHSVPQAVDYILQQPDAV